MTKTSFFFFIMTETSFFFFPPQWYATLWFQKFWDYYLCSLTGQNLILYFSYYTKCAPTVIFSEMREEFFCPSKKRLCISSSKITNRVTKLKKYISPFSKIKPQLIIMKCKKKWRLNRKNNIVWNHRYICTYARVMVQSVGFRFIPPRSSSVLHYLWENHP